MSIETLNLIIFTQERWRRIDFVCIKGMYTERDVCIKEVIAIQCPRHLNVGCTVPAVMGKLVLHQRLTMKPRYSWKTKMAKL